MLIWPGVAGGSYIIRASSGARAAHTYTHLYTHTHTFSLTFSALADTSNPSYALSVRYEDQKTELNSVRHYRVRVAARNTYYVSHNRTFQGFSKLIEHYSSARAGRYRLHYSHSHCRTGTAQRAKRASAVL